jgi:uncharacterized protein YdiU (UPF0061 family)
VVGNTKRNWLVEGINSVWQIVNSFYMWNIQGVVAFLHAMGEPNSAKLSNTIQTEFYAFMKYGQRALGSRVGKRLGLTCNTKLDHGDFAEGKWEDVSCSCEL